MHDFVCALTHVTSTFLRCNVRQRTERDLRAPFAPWLCAQCCRSLALAGIFRGGDLVCERRRAVCAAGPWPGDGSGVVGEKVGAQRAVRISRAASLRANGRFQTGMGEQSCGREAALPVCVVMKSGCRRQPGPGQCLRKCREPCCRHSLRVPGRPVYFLATP